VRKVITEQQLELGNVYALTIVK